MINNLEIKGEWSIPGAETSYNGILKFDPKIGARLEVFGSFNQNFFDRSPKEIIVGITLEGEVTLVDCYYKTSKYRDNGFSVSIYEPIIILLGETFNTAESIRFSSTTFNIYNHYNWINPNGLSHSIKNSINGYTIEYKKKDKINFNLFEGCNGTISFESPIYFGDYYSNIEIKESSSFTLNYDSATNIKIILRDIRYLVELTTFFVQEQSYPLNISFKKETLISEKEHDPYYQDIECIFHFRFYNPNYKIQTIFNHIIEYQNLKNIYPSIIEKWYEKHSNFDQVFTLTLAWFQDKYTFTTEKFMEAIRALEIYHRSTHKNEVLNSEEYQNKLIKILDNPQLCENDKEWLEERLRYGNEPSLKNRLIELISEHSNSFISTRISKKKPFAQKVVDSRNYYTHFDVSLKNRALSGKDLYEFTQTLRGILYSCIMREIGIEDKYYEKKLEHHFT